MKETKANTKLTKDIATSEFKHSKKAIFFLRHNNDIDHIVPVLYKWLSTQNIPTDVIITTKKEHLNDKRIVYLKQFKNVRILHINDLFKKYSLPYFFNRFYFKEDTKFDNLFKKHNYLRKKADNQIKKITNKFFENMQEGIVVFDWTTTYFVHKIVEISKQKGFTTISLPHGDRPYISLLETIDTLNYDGLKAYEPYKIFDYVVVPNKINTDRYNRFIKGDKLKVLGSPRYCDEWMKIISDFIPTYEEKESKDNLKIIFFLRNTGYPVFWDEVVRTIKLIMQFEGIYLIVKHHPRNRNAKKLTEQLLDKYPDVRKNLGKNLKFIYEGVDSGSLLKWADVVIDIGTSVTWEAVKQNKPVLMIEYLYSNYSTIACYIPETEIKCRDDLYHALEKLLSSKKEKFYDEKNRENFISEIIDTPDKKVLERYCSFLKECLNEKNSG